MKRSYRNHKNIMWKVKILKIHLFSHSEIWNEDNSHTTKQRYYRFVVKTFSTIPSVRSNLAIHNHTLVVSMVCHYTYLVPFGSIITAKAPAKLIATYSSNFTPINLLNYATREEEWGGRDGWTLASRSHYPRFESRSSWILMLVFVLPLQIFFFLRIEES